jgi:predicted RND superfamily exporter protein
LLPVLAALHQAASGITIDRHNTAMQADGSAVEANEPMLREEFGEQDVLVCAFRNRANRNLTNEDRSRITELAAALRQEPGVQSVGPRLDPRPDCAVLRLGLAPDADAIAICESARKQSPPQLLCVSGGMPFVEQSIAEAVAEDRARVVPAIAASLFLLLAIWFRSIRVAVAALAPAALTLAFIGALRAWAGKRLDPIAVLVDPVLLTVAVAAAVHLVMAYRTARGEGAQANEAARLSRQDLIRPATLATFTTMLGFWSLCFNRIPAVAEFGAWSAFGVGVAHALTVWMLPSLLVALDVQPAANLASAAHRTFDVGLRRHRRAILWSASFSAVLAMLALRDARIDNDPLHILPSDHPCRQQMAELTELLGGADSFGLLIAKSAARMGADRVLPFVAAVASMAPASGPAGPALMSASGAVLAPILLATSGSDARTNLFAEVDARAAALGFEGIAPSGAAVRIARNSTQLVQGQLMGIALTCVLLWITLLVSLRSFRLAFVGILPNALPCLWLYGGLAAIDEPITVASAMIGSVMLGLVVDNTIHFLHRYREGGGSAVARVGHALSKTAAPMMASSLVLAIGLGAGLVGGMRSTHEFAALAAATIVLALIGDAIVLPALLLRAQRASEAA